MEVDQTPYVKDKNSTTECLKIWIHEFLGTILKTKV